MYIYYIMCICKWRPEIDVECLPQLLSIFLGERGSLTEFINLASLAEQQAPGTLEALPHRVEITLHHNVQVLLWVLRSNSGPCDYNASIYRMPCLLRPPFMVFLGRGKYPYISPSQCSSHSHGKSSADLWPVQLIYSN